MNLLYRSLVWTACFFFLNGYAQSEPAQVTVEAGTLRGAASDGVRVFRGIPYAAAPVGKLRWRPPQAAAHWEGARDATAFGPACPQGDVPDMIDGMPGRMSEDCLYLNIWAPANTKAAPVMVWLHGGGNTSGAGSRRYYDGSAFARNGVVLVTINYRLGLLGFFAHPALTAEAGSSEPLVNFALMDQIAALRWVQKNIAAFGGDPKNVTAFGESAGGEDLLTLMTIPSAHGLFAKAIVESGGGWWRLRSLRESETAGEKLAQQLGIGTAATAEELRGIPKEKLVKSGLHEDGLTVDGRLLSSQPTRLFAQGKAAAAPLVIGSNSYEGSLLDIFSVKPAEVFSEFPADEITRARALYGAETSDDILAHELFRDLNFAAPAEWIAQHSPAHAPVYLYRFSYVRQHQLGRAPGAPHGSEIPYVFDSWSQSPTHGMFLLPRDRAEAGTLHHAWVEFAKTGSPGWPAYRPADDELLEFGGETGPARGLDTAKLNFFEKHEAKLLSP